MADTRRRRARAEPEEVAPTKRSVDERSDWLVEDDAAHELALGLREGVPAMREHARAYRFMRPNPGEMEKVEIGGSKEFSLYDLRIDRSDLPNPWADSIRATARLPFRSAIVLEGWDVELSGRSVMDENGKLVERIPGWVDTLTAEGQTLDEYAAETFEDSLFEGIVYSFVDNDPRKFNSPADRIAAGAQPRVTKFRRCHIVRITIEFRFGVPRLKQVVLEQPITKVDVSDPNAWIDEVTPARKVITAGDPDADPKTPEGKEARTVRTQVYVKDAKGEKWVEDVSLRGAIIPDDPADELLDIPLVPHYTMRKGPWRGHSPFLDTAWTEAAIWNHNSEVSNLAREVALIHVHLSGVSLQNEDPTKPILGDTRNARVHWSTDPQGRMTIGEMNGTALKAVRELIEWKIRLIEKAHHQLQTEKPTGPVTAREITLEGVRASSALEMWVIFQERAWKRILDLVALLGGLKKRGLVGIPHDFGLPSAGMDRLHQLFITDHMSPGGYWPEAKRAGDVDEQSFDLKAELAWWEEKKKQAAAIADAKARQPGAAGGLEPPEDEEDAAREAAAGG
jgi:hypothetical protein